MADETGDIQGAFGGMSLGVVESLFRGIFQRLQQGKDTFKGAKDPVLAKVKPFYDRGLVQSWKDLQRLVQANYDPILAGLSGPQQPAATQTTSAQKAGKLFSKRGGSLLGKERSPDAPTTAPPRRYGSELGRATESAAKAEKLYEPRIAPPPQSPAATPPPLPTMAEKARKVASTRQEPAKTPKVASARQGPPPLPSPAAQKAARVFPKGPKTFARTPTGKLGKRWGDQARKLFNESGKESGGFGGERETARAGMDDAATKKLTEAMEKLAEKIGKPAGKTALTGKRGEDNAERPFKEARQPASPFARGIAREAGRLATVGNRPGPVERLVGQMVQRAVLSALTSGS